MLLSNSISFWPRLSFDTEPELIAIVSAYPVLLRDKCVDLSLLYNYVHGNKYKLYILKYKFNPGFFLRLYRILINIIPGKSQGMQINP